MNIGFIGLGAMGLPMTRHIIDAGHDVTVSSRSRAPIDMASRRAPPIGFAARAETPLLRSGIVRQLLGAATAAGYGREDFSSMGKIVRALGGL